MKEEYFVGVRPVQFTLIMQLKKTASEVQTTSNGLKSNIKEETYCICFSTHTNWAADMQKSICLITTGVSQEIKKASAD